MALQYFTDNQIFSLAASSLILIASITTFHIGKIRTSLILLFLGSIGLGFFIANLDHFLILWDEQFHALVAKNMLKNPIKPILYPNPLLEYDYKNWSGNYIWLHKQPLFLWQIALSLKVFGINELAVRIPSILMHAFVVLMTYRIGKISYNINVGFYGALFFAVAYYPLELVAGRYSTDHNDVAFLFYIIGSLWAWFEYQNSQNKYWLILVGIFSGGAVLVKWLFGLLIYPVWAIISVVEFKKKRMRLKEYYPIAISFALSLVVFVPWQLFIYFKYPVEYAYESQIINEHLFRVVENHGGNFWFHFDALKVLYGSGSLVPVFLFLGLFILIKNSSVKIYRLAILLSILITYGFYSIVPTKMISFCVVISPIAYLGFGALVNTTVDFIKLKIKFKIVEMFLRPVVLFIACLFLVNLSRIQRNHTDWKPNDNNKRKTELNEMAFIRKLPGILKDDKFVVFNTKIRAFGNIPVMFYTDYIAYDIMPSREQIEKITSQSYKIAIWDNDSLPDYIRQDNDIIKIKL